MASSCPPILARLLACAALALALVPATAHAASDLPVPAAEPLMITAHTLAVARWGMDPCGGAVTVSWGHMGPGINARSQWMSIDAHDPSTFTECSISYNLDVSWDWPKLCTVVEHELGHLAGHDHVNDPHDVMSPYYVYPAPECAPVGAQAATTTPAVAPRKATSVSSSRRAASTKAAAKRKATAKRKAQSRRRAKSKGASSARRTKAGSTARVALAASLSAPGYAGFFGCVLVDAR